MDNTPEHCLQRWNQRRMGRRRAEVVAFASVLLWSFILNLLCSPFLVSAAVSACPWGRDPKLTELRAACLCATNIAQQLSVQVSPILLWTNLTWTIEHIGKSSEFGNLWWCWYTKIPRKLFCIWLHCILTQTTYDVQIQGVFLTGTPPKSSKYKKVNLG